MTHVLFKRGKMSLKSHRFIFTMLLELKEDDLKNNHGWTLEWNGYFPEITGSACNHLIIFVIVFRFPITLTSTRGEHEKHMQMLKIFLFRTLKTNSFSKIDYIPAYVQEKDCQTEI